MRKTEVRERAFAMPLTNPAYPPGPYRFIDREYLIITYRTDPAKLRAIVPEPLEFDERAPSVNYEFSRLSMEDHWRAGYHDAVRTLRHPEVLERPRSRDGIFIFDFHRDGRE